MWTEKKLRELQQDGKIKSFSVSSQPVKVRKKRSKEKEHIDSELSAIALLYKTNLSREHRFCPERKWRFDWSFNEQKVAVEYEGLMSKKSRHTTISGFTGDTEKYNRAQELGWVVLRFTALNYADVTKIVINNLKNKHAVQSKT